MSPVVFLNDAQKCPKSQSIAKPIITLDPQKILRVRFTNSCEFYCCFTGVGEINMLSYSSILLMLGKIAS